MTSRLLHDIPQAAGLLGVNESWLRDKVRKRLVAHTRLGRQVRFTDEQLAQIIAAAEEPTIVRPALTRRHRATSARPTLTA